MLHRIRTALFKTCMQLLYSNYFLKHSLPAGDRWLRKGSFLTAAAAAAQTRASKHTKCFIFCSVVNFLCNRCSLRRWGYFIARARAVARQHKPNRKYKGPDMEYMTLIICLHRNYASTAKFRLNVPTYTIHNIVPNSRNWPVYRCSDVTNI